MTLTFEELLDSLEDAPDATNALLRELRCLPDELRHCGIALAYYSKSLVRKGRFARAGARYVLAPLNFVVLTPRYKRGQHITVELRGNVSEFQVLDGVPLKDARAGAYSSCVLRRPADLAAVTSYIRRARELYARGASRARTTPVTTEVQSAT